MRAKMAWRGTVSRDDGRVWRWVVAAAVLVIAVRGPAAAQTVTQERESRLRATAMVGSTVSVATLRIPEKAWRHFDKAKSAAEHNKSAECDKEALKAIEIAPGFAEAYLLRANQQERAHEFEAAIASVERARRTEPDAMWAGTILAGALNGLGRYDEARAALTRINGAEAQTWQVKYEYARSAIGTYDVEAALRWSELAMAGESGRFADMHIVRANALLLAHRWSDAAAQLEAYLGSKEPQSHHTQVAALLAQTQLRMREGESTTVASR